jgi:hypothetical protein
MPLFDVDVRQVSTVTVSVSADSAEDARNRVYRGEGQDTSYEFIESREIIGVREEDTRFDYEDDTELIDDYEIEQEETDE